MSFVVESSVECNVTGLLECYFVVGVTKGTLGLQIILFVFCSFHNNPATIIDESENSPSGMFHFAVKTHFEHHTTLVSFYSNLKDTISLWHFPHDSTARFPLTPTSISFMLLITIFSLSISSSLIHIEASLRR